MKSRRLFRSCLSIVCFALSLAHSGSGGTWDFFRALSFKTIVFFSVQTGIRGKVEKHFKNYLQKLRFRPIKIFNFHYFISKIGSFHQEWKHYCPMIFVVSVSKMLNFSAIHTLNKWNYSSKVILYITCSLDCYNCLWIRNN